ncbi:MAG TPA: glycosyltransferase family 4 protein [Actinomycetales bacterium]
MIETESPFHRLAHLDGARIVVLNWRDIEHPQAGGAEQYMHQIARRWVAAGAQVTWLTARGPKQARRAVIDGIEVVRVGGALSLYPLTALALLRRFGRIDYVVDCQNGIPFFSPLFVQRDVPVVQVVHHVHQDQFAMRFGPVLAAVGRFLEGRGTQAVYGERPIAAVSPSTRQELRRRLRFRGPIHIVPNGNSSTPEVRSPRDPEPTITIVARLVPHKRVDVLLAQLAVTAAAVPNLRVDIVGDGPERIRLATLSAELGLSDIVTFHGFQPDATRDELLRRAWLTMSTSSHEGWGLSIVEAAAHGVPTIALRAPGVRDSVVNGSTGWLVDEVGQFGAAAAMALRELADEQRARDITEACQAWARCFTWDRSAGLLAGVLIASVEPDIGPGDRSARSDMGVVVEFDRPNDLAGALTYAALRPTDQMEVRNGRVGLLLTGCDEVDAAAALKRLGITDASVRLADRYDLLGGPARLPEVLTRLHGPGAV